MGIKLIVKGDRDYILAPAFRMISRNRSGRGALKILGSAMPGRVIERVRAWSIRVAPGNFVGSTEAP
jgi:hypothetical protein